MTVSSVDNSKAAAAAIPTPPNPKGDMANTETFMKLLVAELKQQDPMDPMKNRDMVAQLATLSSVQKLSTIDQKLGALQAGSMADTSMQSANLIGKKVTASTNRVTLNSTGTPTGSYKLQNNAGTVSINLVDSSGQVVRTLDAGAQSGGGPEWRVQLQHHGGRRQRRSSPGFHRGEWTGD
jgi:flagellar basal-body rod modification protein FlgD